MQYLIGDYTVTQYNQKHAYLFQI